MNCLLLLSVHHLKIKWEHSFLIFGFHIIEKAYFNQFYLPFHPEDNKDSPLLQIFHILWKDVPVFNHFGSLNVRHFSSNKRNNYIGPLCVWDIRILKTHVERLNFTPQDCIVLGTWSKYCWKGYCQEYGFKVITSRS